MAILKMANHGGGIIDTVRVFAIIASFILLITCIDFMNFDTQEVKRVQGNNPFAKVPLLPGIQNKRIL